MAKRKKAYWKKRTKKFATKRYKLLAYYDNYWNARDECEKLKKECGGCRITFDKERLKDYYEQKTTRPYQSIILWIPMKCKPKGWLID